MINITKYYLVLILFFFILGCTNNQSEKNVFNPSKIDLKVLNTGKKNIQKYEFYIINFWASWCIPCKNEVLILNIRLYFLSFFQALKKSIRIDPCFLSFLSFLAFSNQVHGFLLF